MATLREWLSRVWGTLRLRSTDRELEQELRLHVELATEDARRAADSPESAARAARIRAGGVAQAMEALRDQRGLPWLEDLVRDLRYGYRMLVRNSVFTLISVVSLAIGVGANAAVFSFADGLLLRPLPVPRPGEVMTVGTPSSVPGYLFASYRDFVDIREHSTSLEGLAASVRETVGVATETDVVPNVRRGMLVSGNFFQVLGLVPQLGRTFRPDEDQVPGRDAVVVLGHDFWERQLGGDRSIVGRTVRLNGIPFTVIGVALAGFTGLDHFNLVDLYVPLMMWPRVITDSGIQPLDARDYRVLDLRGRLRPSTTIAQAQAELSILAADLERAHPDTNRNRRIVLRTELQNRIAQVPPVAILLAMLTMLAGAVLFVACANVSGLLASRALTRAREIGLRMALGAGRSRLMRQLMTESALIALAGGSLGLVVGYLGVMLFKQMPVPAEVPLAFELDRRVFLVSLATAVVSALVFGLLPAMRSTRADLTKTMKGGDATGEGRRRQWGRPLLVGGQVAVAVVLLVVATFIYRGFQKRISIGPGYRTDQLLMLTFEPRMARYSEAQAQQFFEEVAERARSVPGVESAALASTIPMNGFSPIPLVPEGFQFPVGVDSVSVSGAMVDEHYFDTMRLPILKGRRFLTTDSAGAPRVAIVNEQFAQHYWPDYDPLGKRFRVDGPSGPWVEIVGVAKTSKYLFLVEPPREFVYFPYQQHPSQRMTLLVASAGDPSSLVTPLREVVRALNANLPIFDLRTMEDFYRMRVLAIMHVLVTLIAAMGTMALALAIVGLYGLIAYGVSRRTREIGIRMAIGADQLDVLWMVLRQGMMLAVVGLGVGLLAGVAADRAMVAIFPGGAGGDGHTDSVAFLLVAVTVLAVTLLAVYVPARRATCVNPTEALRSE